ncbi:uncharacterized protein LOC123307815 isoform X2 [Coccinella septempunctata]|nr:uncharacterized protein LOC123307815 isoform X2 [Coccinella septempunctata]
MVMCWAPDCKHYSERETCKFFKFPKDPKLRNKWMKLVRRDIEAGPYARLCSCHFKDGEKENLPTLFIHNVNKRFTFSSPEKKKRSIAICTASSQTVAQDVESVERVSPAHFQEDNQAADNVGTSTSTVLLETENFFLQKRITQLENESSSGAFSFKVIEKDDNLCKLFTGIPTVSIFLATFELLEDIPLNYYSGWNVEEIPKIDQFLMCLMKLRQNYPRSDLAHRFGVSQATATNIIMTWIHILHAVLFKQLNSHIPSRKKNQTCLPTAFNMFTNCRIVLDCTEIAMTVPRESMSTQKATYSSYKHTNTWKALIGVAPNWVVTYVSTLYPGASSDKKIVQECGILENLEAGDLILADKGFLIRDLLPDGVNVNIPPFLVTAQFTPTQVEQTESIAKARIHVERAIQRMKTYKILNFIPSSLFEQAGVIVQVIGALTNLQRPLIDEVKSDSFSEGE